MIAGSGANFSDVVYQNCLNKSASFNYTSPDQCANRYGGHGYVIQYNFTALHVAPLFQALADEAIIRQATNNDQFRIKVTIAPLPVTNYEEGLGASEDSFYLFVLVVISFPIIAGAFGAFIVTERESKAKHLQTVAGVEPAAYWISSLLWDTLNYQIPLWLTIALFFIFKMETLTTTDNDVFPAILTLLFLYGPAAAAYTYCLSFAFTSPSVCTMVSIISGFLVGLAGPLAIFIMQILSADPTAPSSKLENAASIVTWVLRFNPTFCLGKGLFFVLNLDSVGFIEGKQGAINAWTKPVLLLEVVFLGVHIVGYLILAILLDMWSTNPAMMSIGKQVINIISFKWLCPSHDAGDTQYETPDDSDVIREEERVLSGGANGDLIVISQLMKVYDNGKKAVDNVSLGIPHGTCFGLLGINGAFRRSVSFVCFCVMKKRETRETTKER